MSTKLDNHIQNLGGQTSRLISQLFISLNGSILALNHPNQTSINSP